MAIDKAVVSSITIVSQINKPLPIGTGIQPCGIASQKMGGVFT